MSPSSEADSPRTPIPGTDWVVPLCMSSIGPCQKDVGHSGEHGYREQEAAIPGLDVDRLGFRDLLDIGQAILDRGYPPDTIVCSHDPRADIGPRAVAGIADLIATCRSILQEASSSTAAGDDDRGE